MVATIRLEINDDYVIQESARAFLQRPVFEGSSSDVDSTKVYMGDAVWLLVDGGPNTPLLSTTRNPLPADPRAIPIPGHDLEPLDLYFSIWTDEVPLQILSFKDVCIERNTHASKLTKHLNGGKISLKLFRPKGTVAWYISAIRVAVANDADAAAAAMPLTRAPSHASYGSGDVRLAPRDRQDARNKAQSASLVQKLNQKREANLRAVDAPPRSSRSHKPTPDPYNDKKPRKEIQTPRTPPAEPASGGTFSSIFGCCSGRPMHFDD